MPDYGLGLGLSPNSFTIPQPSGLVDLPPTGEGNGGGGGGSDVGNPSSDLGLGSTAPATPALGGPAPNGGASGGAGGGGFTPGQGLNWQGASPSDLYSQFQGLDPTLQQSYVNYYMNNLDPTQQAAWRNAFGQNQPALDAANPNLGGTLGGQKSYGGAIADPSMQIHAQQPQLGLAGPPPSVQEGALGSGSSFTPQAPNPAFAQPPLPGAAQLGSPPNMPGGPGTLQNAQTSPGDYWQQHQNDAFASGANQGPDSPGGGGSGDPWKQPQLGTQGYAQGPGTVPAGQWGAGQPSGGLIKWDQPGGPAPSLTQGGQESLNQPFQAGGQPFTGLQSLLDFMATSTPQQQQLKRQMESKDAQGGSLEPGEGNLFDQMAPYLGTKTNTPPSGATPFTNWDPVGLLKLLKQAGIIGG